MLYVSRPCVDIDIIEKGKVVYFDGFPIFKVPIVRSAYYYEHEIQLFRKPTRGPTFAASGCRSLLFTPYETGHVYRIKACAFDPSKPEIFRHTDGHIFIQGGQFRHRMENERDFSERFNKILISEGIDPPMTVVGCFDYDIKAGKKDLVATIMKVRGDTRLDEIFGSIESLGSEKIEANAREFYELAGECVGSLLWLMHTNGMTWSSNDKYRSNSHIGNVCVYPVEEDMGFGLLDFDDS